MSGDPVVARESRSPQDELLVSRNASLSIQRVGREERARLSATIRRAFAETWSELATALPRRAGGGDVASRTRTARVSRSVLLGRASRPPPERAGEVGMVGVPEIEREIENLGVRPLEKVFEKTRAGLGR